MVTYIPSLTSIYGHFYSLTFFTYTPSILGHLYYSLTCSPSFASIYDHLYTPSLISILNHLYSLTLPHLLPYMVTYTPSLTSIRIRSLIFPYSPSLTSIYELHGFMKCSTHHNLYITFLLHEIHKISFP